ncbi:very short patch repair endonuclease [Pseudomonas sp. 11/12A]|uniref:very short patch repair endonuclease n=1 Tax=Pseudomonas sp. 11/12A TaxID=1506582 RepID=UPI0009DD0DC0|nr:very short patch repair endonuclease [Pseudomonas sp. 11/12A]
MDIVSNETRSKIMANIKSKNTSPEKKIRKLIHSYGFRYRLHPRDLPGKPDLVLRRYNLCIFVNGCFWHRHPRCKLASTPQNRNDFWSKKFLDNITRDIKNRNILLRKGWRVFDIWECGTRGSSPDLKWLIEAIPDMDKYYVSWPQN